LREELRVVLYPERVLMLRIGRELTRRGMVRRVIETRTVPCAAAEGADAAWSAAIATLAAELPALAYNTAFATVILSNHFMRYALVPWSAALKDAAEEAVYTRHFFRQLYGSAAESWDLRLNADRPGAAQLASAVDGRLAQAVRNVFDDAGIRLRSMQPGLMAAYNSCRDRLQAGSAWFVLFEPGNLCVALLQQGAWRSIRSLRARGDCCASLPHILERESCLTEHEAATDEVFLWAPEIEKPVLPQGARWKLHALQPAIQPGLLPDYERHFAMAMGG
jgi:hypothetical protein